MKNQALFSSKDKSKKLRCYLLQFLFGVLRAEIVFLMDCWLLTGSMTLRRKYCSSKVVPYPYLNPNPDKRCLKVPLGDYHFME